MMPLQRACDAENQVRNKLSNGPRRAQSNEQGDKQCSEYSAIGFGISTPDQAKKMAGKIYEGCYNPSLMRRPVSAFTLWEIEMTVLPVLTRFSACCHCPCEKMSCVHMVS